MSGAGMNRLWVGVLGAATIILGVLFIRRIAALSRAGWEQAGAPGAEPDAELLRRLGFLAPDARQCAHLFLREARDLRPVRH